MSLAGERDYKNALTRLSMNDDEVLYERVSHEMADGDIKEGMWTKAYANALGDEGKAKALYIRMRVEQLAREEAQKERSALGVDDDPDDDEGAKFAFKSIEERIPPQVLNALQIGGFVVGMIAIWVFRHDLGNIGRRLKQMISGGG